MRIILVVTAMVAMACSEESRVEKPCTEICEKYDECGGPWHDDVDTCIETCVDAVEDCEDEATKVAECISDASCSELEADDFETCAPDLGDICYYSGD
jgi:hypothetical protein